MAEADLALDKAEVAGDIRSDLAKTDNEVQSQIRPGLRLALQRVEPALNRLDLLDPDMG